jgi:hypothetical protein
MKKILIGIISLSVFCVATQAYAAIAFVQSTSTVSAAIGLSATSASMTFPSNNTANNLIVVLARWQDGVVGGTSTITSVTDTKGNTYQPAFEVMTDASSATPTQTQVWFSANIVAGANTVTVNYATSTNGNGTRMAIFEYSGIATTSPIDTYSTQVNSAASTTWTSGAVPTNYANDLIFGGITMAGSSHSMGAGSGFTLREPTSAQTVPYGTEDKIVSVTGTYAATGTISSADDSAAFMVAFHAPLTNTIVDNSGAILFTVAAPLTIKNSTLTIDN